MRSKAMDNINAVLKCVELHWIEIMYSCFPADLLNNTIGVQLYCPFPPFFHFIHTMNYNCQIYWANHFYTECLLWISESFSRLFEYCSNVQEKRRREKNENYCFYQPEAYKVSHIYKFISYLWKRWSVSTSLTTNMSESHHIAPRK